MFKKGILMLSLLIFFAISFSVYIHEENIDDLAYVIAIGVDKGTEDSLSISFQISLPSKSKNSSSDSSSENSNDNSKQESKDTTIKTVECKSIISGLNSVDNIASKRIDLSHCKLIIFSEEVAKDGISNFIYTLENKLELRSNCSILVSKTSAKTFLENTIPTFESSTVSYYESLRNSPKSTGYSYNVTLNDLYTNISDSFGEPCAMLCSLIEENDLDKSRNNSNENQNNQLSSIKIDGLAVFKNDKFVGELSSEESLCFLIITNNLKQTSISIPSPFKDNNQIDIHISKFSNTQNKVEIKNSIPHIYTKVFIDSTIMSSNTDFDANSTNELNFLEKSISDYFKNSILKYYDKISKEYNSDICGLGKHAVHYFLTEQDWNNYNWNNKFSEAVFNVDVNVNVNTSYFIS